MWNTATMGLVCQIIKIHSIKTNVPQENTMRLCCNSLHVCSKHSRKEVCFLELTTECFHRS